MDNTSARMDLGNKIKELRNKKGLTQEELADRCELSKGFISQLENDLTSPSIATLMDILQCLGTSLKDFFNDADDEQIVFGKDDFFEKIDTELHNKVEWIIPNAQKKQDGTNPRHTGKGRLHLSRPAPRGRGIWLRALRLHHHYRREPQHQGFERGRLLLHAGLGTLHKGKRKKRRCLSMDQHPAKLLANGAPARSIQRMLRILLAWFTLLQFVFRRKNRRDNSHGKRTDSTDRHIESL